MKKKLLAIMSVMLLGAPLYAGAAPIQYDVTYTAVQGPNGTGSFSFDSALGAISGFTWDFGGAIGGIADGTYGTSTILSDTFGRLVFEILSQTDTHAVVDCIVGSCSVAADLIGAGPSDATTFILASGNNQGPIYQFETEDGFVAQGKIALSSSQVSVPEPATIALFAGSLIGMIVARRRRNA